MPVLPSLPAPEKSRYSAEQAPPLNRLDTDSISRLVADLNLSGSEKEHYLTGWLGSSSLVIIHNYQDKRGTSSGFMLTKPGAYRFSVQAITFRIPKILLWATLRFKPRTMALIAYQPIDRRAGALVQYRNIADAGLKAELEQRWREINDYLGEACWQKEHDYPLWNTLKSAVSEHQLEALFQRLSQQDKKLQQDGEFSGLWQDDLFIAVRPAGEASAIPSLLIGWRDGDDMQSYLYGWLNDEQGQPQLAMAFRPAKDEAFFTLNPFDAAHLQQARALAEIALAG